MRDILGGKPWDVLTGDCLDLLKTLPDASVDSCVTDPPYGLSFMGKKWDTSVPGVEVWEQVLRVLKPGSHLLCFFGTRTYHRGVVAIEDAGFEIRDQLAWMYGSGFPKSHNLSGEHEGWGSALKPAWEPVVLARKPLEGTISQNVEAHGTGALNIDGCRVAAADSWSMTGGGSENGISTVYDGGAKKRIPQESSPLGRWPANVCHDGSDEVEAAFARFGESVSSNRTGDRTGKSAGCYGAFAGSIGVNMGHSDSGTASRFFFCGKASREDRNEGLGKGSAPLVSKNATMQDCERADWSTRNGNPHPTVKPTDLMRWLCRLITPPGGLVLDPFTGSGSTGKAAMIEGFRFLGCELDEQYADIARARIAAAAAQPRLDFTEPEEQAPKPKQLTIEEAEV